MATSIFTDCSSMQGSTTSSSSDMLTLTTAASSWCAIPASTRIRIVRLIRPHSRRILVTPGAIPSYGFAVRGGKEFSSGFFVSSVDRNSEAEQKGLRIGDQILRINGFRIDDAIHKEFVQLISHQERLLLKVRSVGMLPVKDKENDYLTWNVVKSPSISSTVSECSYKSMERNDRDRNHSRNQGVINVVLNVAPRTKLGLGICKGPEWKPGIFVQFTKEKSVAREAGLRPGDQILTVNSIDFSDVLFSEAVAVMKSSSKLDMTVHTGAGCDLFPGESSGYNSSASSVTGDQSPCWADVKSKRLTAVREETSNGQPGNWNQPVYANERKYRSKSITERSTNSHLTTTTTNLAIRQSSFSSSPPSVNSLNGNKEINKTIIKLSESGTSINNTFVTNQPQSSNSTGTIRKTLTNARKENLQHQSERDSRVLEGGGTLTKLNQSTLTTSNNIPPPPPPNTMSNHHHQQQLSFSGDSTTSSSSSNNYTHNNMRHDDDVDGDIRIGGVAATMQRYRYAHLQMTKQNNNGAISETTTMGLNLDNGKSSINSYDGGSLSSAITEELKKRKAKRQPNNHKEHTPHNELKPLQYDSKREVNINQNIANANASNSTNNNLNAVDDQHSALMNEFKQAHKRMFKNGFNENGEPLKIKDRQEALMHTTILDDAGTCRSKGTKQHTVQATQNGSMDSSESQQNSHIPIPPPPQMAGNTNKAKTTQQINSPYTKSYTNEQNVALRISSESQSSGGRNSDIYSRPNKTKSFINNSTHNNSTEVNSNSAPVNNRHTLRLGAVTIGEYRNNTLRREPEKFDFIATQKRDRDSGETTPTNEALHSELQNTLSRANLRKTNGNSYLEHQRNCPLHQQQQQLHQHDQSVDYGNGGYTVEEIAKKLQKSSLDDMNSQKFLTKTNNSSNNNVSSTGGVGILKNGNRNSGNSSSKSTEKSIKFG